MERLSEFVPRLLLSLLVAFLLFPLGFVIAHSGLGAEEFLGSVIMMFFLQFISPYQFWVWPTLGGIAAAAIWQCVARLPGKPSPD